LGQFVVRPTPSSAPFIVDAKQAAKRQAHHAVRISGPSDYLPYVVQNPLRTGQSLYVQSSGVSECDSGRRNVGIRHLNAATPDRLWQGIVDLTGIIPVQPCKVDEGRGVVSTSDPVRRPQWYPIRG
jgi:hypothetical protein